MYLQNICISKHLPATPSSPICLRLSLTRCRSRLLPRRICAAASSKSSSDTAPEPHESVESVEPTEARTLRTTKPRKPRRGRRSEAAAVEDFVRDSLDRTFASIRQQNPEVFDNYKEDAILKHRKVSYGFYTFSGKLFYVAVVVML